MSGLAFASLMALGLSIPFAYKLGKHVGQHEGYVAGARHPAAQRPVWSEALIATDIDHEGLHLPAGTPGCARPIGGAYELLLTFQVLPADLLVVGAGENA